MKIILASASPRRKTLLDSLLNKYNLGYSIMTNNINEDTIKENDFPPDELVKKLSYLKAEEIFLKQMYKNKKLVVIGADTIVYFDNKILGKPIDEKDAFRTLKKLQGKSSEIYTGMTVYIKKNNSIISEEVLSKATVHINKMTDNDINEYIQTKEPLDKAGSFAIQGIGKKYIQSFDGDFNTIVGLDINSLEKILLKYNLL